MSKHQPHRLKQHPIDHDMKTPAGLDAVTDVFLYLLRFHRQQGRILWVFIFTSVGIKHMTLQPWAHLSNF